LKNDGEATLKLLTMKNLFIRLSVLSILLLSGRCKPQPGPEPDVQPITDSLAIPKLVWKSTISNELTGSICPIVNNNYALFSRSILSADTDPIIAFDKNTGKKLWEWNDYKKKGGLRGYKNTYYTHDDVAVITQGSQVYAIDLKTGKTLWENKVGDTALETVTGIGSTVFQEKFKSVNGSDLPFLAKCDIKTGQWQTFFTDSLMINFTQHYDIAKPFVNSVGDTMLTFTNNAYRLPGNPGGELIMSFVYLINVSKSKLIYKIELSPTLGATMAQEIRKGKAFIASDSKKLICWDIEKGQSIWDIKGTSGYYANVVIEDNKIIASTVEGIQAFDADSGVPLWTSGAFETKYSVSNFEFANGILYFSSGWLYAIDANTGKRLWHYADNKNGEANKGFILKLNVDKASKRIFIGNNLEALCYETIK
jgi:outer membrane protein assembly factor BamB